jgi:tRNA uridine 5-carboxymethylaminomethyl modification enzyme
MKRGIFEPDFLFSNSKVSDELSKRIIIDKELARHLKTEIKYEGYIDRQKREVKHFLENENKLLPDSLNYEDVPSLSTEAREKLSKIRPGSMGQASRIQGVSATDISILTVYLKTKNN